MRSMGKIITLSGLLALMVACGKSNESGKSNRNPLCQGLSSALCNQYTGLGLPQIGNLNSPYSYGGIKINQVMAENPCVAGYPGYPGMGVNNYAGQRQLVQQPLVGHPTVIAPNDIYVGVTSYGDVGVVVGMPAGQPPLFVGYMCPRSFAPQGGQVVSMTIGSYSQCLFKPLTSAVMQFPGGAVANFRWLDGGSSVGVFQNTFRKFTFCR